MNTKIMVVDDNLDFVSILQMMLEDAGYEVKAASDGKAGYSIYLSFKPDLVITDIQMPGRNGMELMEYIRIHNPAIGTIYMTGDLQQHRLSLEDERERYRVRLLEKPFTRFELMELISELTGVHPREREDRERRKGCES